MSPERKRNQNERPMIAWTSVALDRVFRLQFNQSEPKQHLSVSLSWRDRDWSSKRPRQLDFVGKSLGRTEWHRGAMLKSCGRVSGGALLCGCWGESCWEAVCQIVLGAHTGWEQFSLPPACVKRLCNTWNIRESLQKFLTLAEVLN